MSLHEREMEERKAQATGLSTALTGLRMAMDERAQGQMDLWDDWIKRPEFYPSARNLADYLSLAPGELAPFEAPFASFGISSLNRAEPHLRASIDAVLASLALISGQAVADYPPVEVFAAGPARLAARRGQMFGARRHAPHARIMASLGINCITTPPEGGEPRTAESYLRHLIGAGADALRIDLSSGGPEDWSGLAQMAREVAQDLGRRVPVQIDIAGPHCRVARMIGGHGRLRIGDRFEVVEKLVKGDVPRITLSQPAHWKALTEGCVIRINGGKLQGEVVRSGPDRVRVEVTATPPRGARLKPGMPVSLAGAEPELPPLGPEDLPALEVALRHADNLSVSLQTPKAVQAFFAELERLQPEGPWPVIILRIETAQAWHNLPDLIVATGGRCGVGVMISRPELALELGYARLSEVQDTIFWLCRAAEVPVLWAPGLMERLVQEGRQSRAEWNEAALSHPADCVMLEHGPHTIRAIGEMSEVLLRAERFMTRTSARLGGFVRWSA
ncbi:pyruvate kinase [Thioclava sp. GXIMD2076]|uniref:pyruvate kinase n=1 Tax=Thioclava sp. GXIMD2076 TaxID=3131931 RepID=UPI0030CFF282